MTANANNLEQTHEGGNSVGHLPISLQPTASGVYIPIPLTTGPPPPPPPYGMPGLGIHPSYLSGPPPQFITHCSLPPPPTIQGALNSTVAGSDNTENALSSEMTTNNTGGEVGSVISMGPPTGMQFQCPNYPPPPVPLFYATNGVNTSSGSGGSAIGTVAAPTNNVHLVSPFSHQVAGSTFTNQTAFASPHATMGTQVIL